MMGVAKKSNNVLFTSTIAWSTQIQCFISPSWPTHHCWMNRSSMERDVYPELLNMSDRKNRIQTFLICSMPIPLNQALLLLFSCWNTECIHFTLSESFPPCNSINSAGVESSIPLGVIKLGLALYHCYSRTYSSAGVTWLIYRYQQRFRGDQLGNMLYI